MKAVEMKILIQKANEDVWKEVYLTSCLKTLISCWRLSAQTLEIDSSVSGWFLDFEREERKEKCAYMSSEHFSNQRVISLETYKKNGDAVQTPVWVVGDVRTIYVRTDSNTWKVKRIRNNPNVRITPSNMRGQLLGRG